MSRSYFLQQELYLAWHEYHKSMISIKPSSTPISIYLPPSRHLVQSLVDSLPSLPSSCVPTVQVCCFWQLPLSRVHSRCQWPITYLPNTVFRPARPARPARPPDTPLRRIHRHRTPLLQRRTLSQRRAAKRLLHIPRQHTTAPLSLPQSTHHILPSITR